MQELWKHAYQAQYGVDPDQEIATLQAKQEEWRINWQGGYDAGEDWATAMVADVPPPAPTPPGDTPVPDVSRDNLMRIAATRAGIPYALPPDPAGVASLDCSAYVLITFEDVGAPIDATDAGKRFDARRTRTAEQIRQACTPVASGDQGWNAIQPGDLLFFEHTYEPNEPAGTDGHTASHIGISLGAGTHRMWDAHDPGGVQQTDISSQFWQTALFEARRAPGLAAAPPPASGLRPIINADGADISGMLQSAASAAGIQVELALACAIAESGLNPKATRMGAWPDVSFGYGQQIVLYHYLGDHSDTPENIAAVRDGVFADPQSNLNDMCKRLATDLQRVQGVDLSPVGGDPFLAALVVYNSGSWHTADDPWWQTWAGNVANYRGALAKARQRLFG